MGETVVVHVSQEYDVYIGRPGNGRLGPFGNSHPIGLCPQCHVVHDRAAAIAAYKRDFWHRVNTDPVFRRHVQGLRGKRLGCFCKRPGMDPPRACHGDVIVAWLEAGCPLRKTAAAETTEASRTTGTPGTPRNSAETPGGPAVIREFRGRHAFLSNFSPSRHVVRGFHVPTVEHAYQMEKGLPGLTFGIERDETTGQMRLLTWDEKIAAAKTPGAAKRLGRLIPLRPDWETARVEVMARLLDEKFAEPALALQLLATGEALLQEGNRWGDRFWGVDLASGTGENQLGQLLMAKREALRQAAQQRSHSAAEIR